MSMSAGEIACRAAAIAPHEARAPLRAAKYVMIMSAPARANRRQRFHHVPLLVDPAIGGRSLDHGVFAAHLVRRSRIAERSFTRHRISR